MTELNQGLPEKVEFSLWDQEVKSREMYHESTGNLDYDTISDRSRAYWRGLAKEDLLNSGIKVEEKGSAMTEQTEFKVGDKVKYLGRDNLGSGTILGLADERDHPRVHVRFEGCTEYIDEEDTEAYELYGQDYHSIRPDALVLIRSLAEKRADDFRVLEEASRPWRNAPDYYKFPHGVQVTDITSHLNSNGGQAAGYVIRSTRIDGQNKEEDPRESLRKAIDLIQMEIYRLDEKFGDTK